MIWKPTKYFGKEAWREDQGHYLVCYEEHWELIHPKKDGLQGFFGLRADGQPPLPAANKRLGEKTCYGTDPIRQSATVQRVDSSATNAPAA
jgi:hypothetical protein